jgi:hypothetical protein
MINRFRELLPYAEVPIKLELRGKVKGVGAAGEVAPEDGGGPPKSRAVTKPPKYRSQSKPKPKPTAKRGPTRGTRPKHH